MRFSNYTLAILLTSATLACASEKLPRTDEQQPSAETTTGTSQVRTKDEPEPEVTTPEETPATAETPSDTATPTTPTNPTNPRTEPTTNDPVALDDFALEFAQAQCGKLFACCDADERLGLNLQTEASCISGIAAARGYFVNAYKASIAAGRIRYDETRAAGCLERMNGLSCEQFAAEGPTRPAQCDPFVGLMANGASCGLAEECVSNFCDFDTGTCARPPGVNASCYEVCAEGLYCGDESDGACHALKANGASCDDKVECASGACEDDVCTVATRCDG